jgi:hypothetical protein
LSFSFVPLLSNQDGTRLRLLFITYCFGSYQGQALIGVYKRALRIAMEMCDRGHEVFFSCTGRGQYSDVLTERAEDRVHFVNIPHEVVAFEAAEAHRDVVREEISQIAPDLIVIGEAPLAGALWQATLCAVELEVPVVLLDNAYDPYVVEHLVKNNAGMADGIILTGPSSFHWPDAPDYLCQVPPFIELPSEASLAALTDNLGLTGSKVVTVLAYDPKVEQLGISLMEKIDDPELEWLFIARHPEKCAENLGRLPATVRSRAKIIAIPGDDILFGCLRSSCLAIIKYGFMQFSETMALRTPCILIYYEGPRWIDYVPRACLPFLHVTSEFEADEATVAAARRLAMIAREEMAEIHNGEFAATSTAAQFIESRSLVPRNDTWKQCLNLGLTRESIIAALAAKHPNDELSPYMLRASELRTLKDGHLYSVVCGHRSNGEKRYERWWGRIFNSQEAAEGDFAAATGAGRRVLYFSAQDRVLIEEDIGEAMLPPL